MLQQQLVLCLPGSGLDVQVPVELINQLFMKVLQQTESSQYSVALSPSLTVQCLHVPLSAV